MRRSVDEMMSLRGTPNPFKIGDKVKLVCPDNVTTPRGIDVALGAILTIADFDNECTVPRLKFNELDGSWHHSRFIKAKTYPQRS